MRVVVNDVCAEPSLRTSVVSARPRPAPFGRLGIRRDAHPCPTTRKTPRRAPACPSSARSPNRAWLCGSPLNDAHGSACDVADPRFSWTPLPPRFSNLCPSSSPRSSPALLHPPTRDTTALAPQLSHLSATMPVTFHVHGAPVGLTAIVLAVFSSIGGCVVASRDRASRCASQVRLTSPPRCDISRARLFPGSSSGASFPCALSIRR